MNDLISRSNLLKRIDAYGLGSQDAIFIKDIIEEQPKVGEWILCNERLPETTENKKYLVCGKNGGIYIAEFVCKTIDGSKSIGPWWSAKGRYCPNPIAWMSLPEPYRE